MLEFFFSLRFYNFPLTRCANYRKLGFLAESRKPFTLNFTAKIFYSTLIYSIYAEIFRQEDGRLRLRPDISMDGPKYIGKKSSRKTAFESGDSDEDGSLDDEDEKETDGENLQIEFDDGDDNALVEHTHKLVGIVYLNKFMDIWVLEGGRYGSSGCI